MKYASGEEPMVGDVVALANGGTQWKKVERVGQGLYSILVNGYWWPAYALKLVRRADSPLPFLDGSGIFHVAEKPKHRYPRRWKPMFSVGDYWEQLHEGGDVLYHFRNMVSGTGWTVEELEREREETFDHHDAKPDSRFDEGGMYRSDCTVYQSELDTLREKLRIAESKLEAVREAVR